MERFFGGNPAFVILRLVVISIVVGVALSALGLDPLDLARSVERLIRSIYDLSFDAFNWVVRYLLLGAVIVVPVWVVIRLVKIAANRADGSRSSSDKR